MIAVERLSKTFNGTRALDGFSLHVPEGTVFGLVGPNGAGKTTLMKILATLLRPSGGTAAIAGHAVTGDPLPLRRVMGYLPDFPGLYQEMRVREYLEFFADAYHLAAAQKDAAVARALEVSGLGGRQDSFVEELSLGMKQRLTLAKTLLHGPRVLLLDEPATGLDPMARMQFREQMKELRRQGMTILISSHILSDLEDICTHVAFIAEGRNAGDGEGRDILHLEATDAVVECEVEVLGESTGVTELAAKLGRVVETHARTLVLEIVGGEQEAAAALKSLIAAGVPVVRFQPRPPRLERRYRSAFGVRS